MNRRVCALLSLLGCLSCCTYRTSHHTVRSVRIRTSRSNSSSSQSMYVATVGTHRTWDVLQTEFSILARLLSSATGRSIVGSPSNDLNEASVIIAGPFTLPSIVSYQVDLHRHHALIIFVNPENMESTAHGPVGTACHDHLVDLVDVIFSHAKKCNMADAKNDAGKIAISGACAAINSGKNIWTPWWIQSVVNSTCELSEGLVGTITSDEWSHRTKFASLLSSHEAFPRETMFDALSSFATKLDEELCTQSGSTLCGRKVEAAGRAFHNFDFPTDSNGWGKPFSDSVAAELRNYRFTITPENSLSWTQGYTTEKIARAHIAGQIPIFWGDPVDSTVWNTERILIMDDNSGIFSDRRPNMSSVLESVFLLESNAAFRTQFFSNPVLNPSAPQWVHSWCGEAERKIRNGYDSFLSRTNYDRVTI